MSKFMKALFVLALGIALAVPVYAETQNVKVSGSLDAYWFYRSGYDLAKDHGGSTLPAKTTAMDPNNTTRQLSADFTNRTNADDFLLSQTQVEVAADLTDNVSTVVNLVNERTWNGATDTNQYDIALDLAYVQMKEIFYSPLTIKIGRQDIWWGRGFIIGNNNTMWNQQGVMDAPEYSVQTAFDAIRATLDFNPWTIDAIYSKISEGNINNEDDSDLYGVNLGYKFGEYNAVAEGYYLTLMDRVNVNALPGVRSNETNVIGGRVQFDPISQMTLGGEAAYQFGHYTGVTTTSATNKKDRDAWAADLFATYRFDLTWKPDLTVEWVYFSGEGDLQDTNANYGAWNRMFRGRFYTAYEDFRDWQYVTAQTGAQDGTQNSSMLQVKGNLKPLDDLLLTGSYSYFWSPDDIFKTVGNPATKLNDHIGQELDFQVTYDYTEDVSFGLLTAWFFPGDQFEGPNDKTAADIVASAKVSF